MSEGEIAQRVTRVDAGLPTGVVTFLFSDVEGSTQMLEEHRAARSTEIPAYRTRVEETLGSGNASWPREPA